jgi:hypothetical protein
VLHPANLKHDLVEMPFVYGSGWRTAGRICAPIAVQFRG